MRTWVECFRWQFLNCCILSSLKIVSVCCCCCDVRVRSQGCLFSYIAFIFSNVCYDIMLNLGFCLSKLHQLCSLVFLDLIIKRLFSKLSC